MRTTIMLTLVLLTGCFTPNPDNGTVKCGDAARPCQAGYYCYSDGTCWRNGQMPTAGGMTKARAGDSTVAGAVSAKSPSYKVIMSTGQARSNPATSPTYKLKGGQIGGTTVAPK